MNKAHLKTPLGNAILEGDSKGISKLTLTEEASEHLESQAPELQEAIDQLQQYFSGKLKEFSLKLNPQGTDFQKKVWQALLKIPYGRTTSYMDLAKELGDPLAIRAVAAANGKNPLWIFIPCHRVIGSDGSLTGYAGGLWRKKWLLEHEQPSKQQSLFI
ncbi:methylated-DNA--[protein]-cysteine S-methyltransferase [Salinimicrobium sediminilitoris]|uniref:methylated-DNA--[protein]-cysteine S-methyltransferase n=1 Tax=Salinimicrobium sediminilitoris TaxID=2876715 RepID=UPI001E432F3F|nr:methylated-DNA--[protein]-cysteine S-methyltransferase [Salinimicrobium sediminilitoris]MCC8359604.1 methylated-DNA--[protein]-cysteine S-methyltransferase [Salinimicrobium sediminilitoris]